MKLKTLISSIIFEAVSNFGVNPLILKQDIHKNSIVLKIFPLQNSDMISKLLHISKTVKKNPIMIPNISILLIISYLFLQF